MHKMGGVQTHITAHNSALWMNPESSTRLTAVGWVVFCFYAYYFFGELIEWVTLGSKKYWTGEGSALNWIQMVNIALYAIQVLLSLLAANQRPTSIVMEEPVFNLIYPAIQGYRSAVSVQACNVFLNWFKVVAFLSASPLFGLLMDTLTLAAPKVGGFSLVFGIILYGFAQAHVMVFGDYLSDFRTIENSCFTLLRSLLGDFDFVAMQEADTTMGPVFFVLYVSIAVLVILNMIIAIISDAYVEEGAAAATTTTTTTASAAAATTATASTTTTTTTTTAATTTNSPHLTSPLSGTSRRTSWP